MTFLNASCVTFCAYVFPATATLRFSSILVRGLASSLVRAVLR